MDKSLSQLWEEIFALSQENKIRFTPVRGLQDSINAMDLSDGAIYFATDTKMIWLDTYITNKTSQTKKLTRILMGNGGEGGGGNASIVYANASPTDESLELKDQDQDLYYISKKAFGEDFVGLPLEDTLIINSNGWFFRVVELGSGSFSDRVIAKLVSSGTGGGGQSGGSKARNIKIEKVDYETNILNHKSALVTFTPCAAKDWQGELYDETVYLNWELAYNPSDDTSIVYASGSIDNIPSDEVYTFDYGAIARPSAKSTLTLTIGEKNSPTKSVYSFSFYTSELTLYLKNPNLNVQIYPINSNIEIECLQSGNLNKLLEVYWDNQLIQSTQVASGNAEIKTNIREIARNSNGSFEITHGVHTVRLILSSYSNNKKGFSTDPIEFEIATIDPSNNTPVIWLQNYKSEYYNYEDIQIPFRVYDPAIGDNKTTVHLYKGMNEIASSPRDIEDTSSFALFEIIDADFDVQNHYSITCGDPDTEFYARREIIFSVVEDPSRPDFGIRQADSLVLSFDAKGRSNEEPLLKRKAWSYTSPSTGKTFTGKFTNFNWYKNGNGWITDNNKTFLRISNGAKFSIPIGDFIFNSTASDTKSHTFEFEFKINNIQDYSNLIKNITRYANDDELFSQFYDVETGTYKTRFTNYDAFLADYFKNNHVPIEGPGSRDKTYDDLVFRSIEKQINLSAVACGFYNGNNSAVTGLCIGPQDAFFSDGTDTVSVSYVEDMIINLSMVYDEKTKLISIYINGVLTGVIRNSLDAGKGVFSIVGAENEIKAIEFNSDYCDIDLYKIRIYNTALNVNEIVTNYAVDHKDVLIYDQNLLAKYNSAIEEYRFDYDEMLKYNSDHLNSPIMPYIIFDTSPDYNIEDSLSYSKAKTQKIRVEFVNTPLEVAYRTGELMELAGPKGDKLWKDGDTEAAKAEAVKTYYQHHCPSWTGEEVAMNVQGTSSEFYPRRNYKLKTKGDNGVNILLNRGPFAQDYKHDMDGLDQSKFILSNNEFAEGVQYYDKNGNKVAVNSEDYHPGVYYVDNPDYVEPGKESTRQKYWYMDNYTTGTTKFTMKIDFMESSGTYNMGFANLVKNAYSKHPFDDLNRNKAFTTYDEEQTSHIEATKYKEGTTYYYMNHKGNWKNTVADELKITSAEDFALGPVEYAAQHKIPKVLTENSEGWANEDNHQYYNKWYTVKFGYKDFEIPNTKDYRTSIQGFRTLAFHHKKDGSYTYIGMYNMLLDKGSDEMFGFKPDKTTGVDVFQKYLKNKKISKVAECWEFEDNTRTFCSFRDPLNRKDLSFKVYETNPDGTYKTRENQDTHEIEYVPVLNSMQSAPVVADSFEYRYHKDADVLDYVYDPDKKGDKLSAEDTIDYMNENNVDLTFYKESPEINYQARADVVFNTYKNWEKAVAWVWSTNTDSVKSGGTYVALDGSSEATTAPGNEWKENTFYIQVINEVTDEEGNTQYEITYEPDSGSSFDPEKKYYIKYSNEDSEEEYRSAFLSSVVYKPNLFYIMVNGDFVLSTNESFDESLLYYSFKSLTYDELENDGGYDRLVKKCDATDVYDPSITYYSYDGTKPSGQAVKKLPDLTEEAFNENPSAYYKGISITYNNRTYDFDTKEYRSDKFINELSEHFDIEYLATYFVMTEVFECYDSRGKNAMFASWGPQKEGGDYIWYPIFYDIDTQLGINNTGIPSFEYNVDATEDKNFSTSDSILWNNFYKYFKSSAILMKYKHLKGITAGVDSSWGTLPKPPLYTINNIEGWYLTDPKICDSIAMRGVRPLIATNLDEYYKYITITNPISYTNGLTGYMGQGQFEYDANGTYFYALQGDRSLSRKQFLANRLEYIDSWLNQGNYSRGGSNRIWGRIAANDDKRTSDLWVASETDNAKSYWKDEALGIKRHPFDAEYWVNLTPTHSTYVTIGADNEAYPSKKYDGVTPVHFEISSVKSGVQYRQNYPEQLFYIYGMNKMSDVGDMSKLYWQEFKIEGEVPHLTRLLLGSDEVVTDCEDDNNPTVTKEMKWANRRVNPLSIPSGKNASGMPLLKEVNLCNIQINSQSPTLDLSSCQKLQNLRATGSNFTYFDLAEGVALNTLYLPKTVTRLELKEARLLTKVLTEYHQPQRVGQDLVAEPGLFIEGLFDETNPATNLDTLTIEGGSLGYDSYKLLNQYYTALGGASSTKNATIKMTNVNWSPYVLVENGEDYDFNNNSYKMYDYHYGLVDYPGNQTNMETWKSNVANGLIYRVDSSIPEEDINQITNIDMFDAMKRSDWYRIDLSGIIYVNNETPVNEITVRKQLSTDFPNVTFLFNKVQKAPTAEFRYFVNDEDDTTNYVKTNPNSVETIDNTKEETASTVWFSDPSEKYSNISNLRTNSKDFVGWGMEVAEEGEDKTKYVRFNNKIFRILITSSIYEDLYGVSIHEWNRNSIIGDSPLAEDYVFYALYVDHYFDFVFRNQDGSEIKTMKQVSSTEFGINPPQDDEGRIIIPQLDIDDPTGEKLYYVNKFMGWAQDNNRTKIIDLAKIQPRQDMTFYAVYNEVSVYDNVIPESDLLKYFSFSENSTGGYTIALKTNENDGPIYKLSGKVTLPTQYQSRSITEISGFNGARHSITHLFWADPPAIDNPNEKTTRNLKLINDGCFYQSTSLRYYEQPNTCEEIRRDAFRECQSLSEESFTNLLKPIKRLNGSYIFAGAVTGAQITKVIPGHGYDGIMLGAFGSMPSVISLQIGGPNDPCLWDNGGISTIVEDDPNRKIFGGLGTLVASEKNPLKITIYLPQGVSSISDDLKNTLIDEGLYGAKLTWNFTNANL